MLDPHHHHHHTHTNKHPVTPRQHSPSACLPPPPRCSTHLPEELCARIARDLRLLLGPPAPTKLSLHGLCKGAASQPKDVPAWALPHLPAGGDPLGLQWQPNEVSWRGGRGKGSKRVCTWALTAHRPANRAAGDSNHHQLGSMVATACQSVRHSPLDAS